MERPMTPVQQRTYMRQFVKNQSSALYSTGWTKAKVESFTDAQLKEEFEKIQKALANTQVVSDEDSTDEAPILWSALAGWEVISTPLGEINALYRVINSPCYHNKELASPEQTATAKVVPKSVAGSSFSAASSKLLSFVGLRLVMFGSNAMKTNLLDTRSAQYSMIIIISLLKVYVVPTGRVVVPTGRYIVPAGKVIIIVSTG
ncbi:hypothetical protein Tco_0328623 [Tanacetum coccineum]